MSRLSVKELQNGALEIIGSARTHKNHLITARWDEQGYMFSWGVQDKPVLEHCVAAEDYLLAHGVTQQKYFIDNALCTRDKVESHLGTRQNGVRGTLAITNDTFAHQAIFTHLHYDTRYEPAAYHAEGIHTFTSANHTPQVDLVAALYTQTRERLPGALFTLNAIEDALLTTLERLILRAG